MRALVCDPEAATQQWQAVALIGRQQDPGQVERVVDQPRAKRLGEEATQEEQIERAAVGDERRIPAESRELGDRLGGRRCAQDVLVGQADQPLDGEWNRNLRIDNHLELVDRPHGMVVVHGSDLEDPVAAGREPGGLQIECDQMIRVRGAPGHAAGGLPRG